MTRLTNVSVNSPVIGQHAHALNVASTKFLIVEMLIR